MVGESVSTYFVKSKEMLIKYMKENEKNPNEKEWDKFAVKNNCLSSRSMGYINGSGFNKMCRNLRKQINKNKIKCL